MCTAWEPKCKKVLNLSLNWFYINLFTSIIKNMVTVNCYEPSTVQWFALNFRSIYKTAYGKHWHSRNTGRIFTRSQVNFTWIMPVQKHIYALCSYVFTEKHVFARVRFFVQYQFIQYIFLVKHLALLVIDINVNINPLGRTSFWLCVNTPGQVNSSRRKADEFSLSDPQIRSRSQNKHKHI